MLGAVWKGVLSLMQRHPLLPGQFARFGSFEADLQEGKLTKTGGRIRLQEQPFRILALLLEHPGELVTREEIRQKLWSHNTFVEFDAALNTAVRKLREALNDSADNPRFLETVPRRGYRFIAPVALPPEPQTMASIEPRIRRHVYLWVAAAFIVVGAAVGGFQQLRRPGSQIAPKDTIVLADFANSTGDAILDDTLKTALNVSLGQSPFLKVLPDSQITSTLQQMIRPAGTKLTPEVARELCQRAGSKAYIAGAIGNLGSKYVLGLKAIDCQNGDTLAQEQVTTASKEDVLDALGQAASKLRGELGESLATMEKFDVPLVQATTSSLDALKAYSLARKASDEKGHAAAIRYDQRAIALDPTFATGYHALGDDYLSVEQLERASHFYTKAFQLRERASERERLAITADFYQCVTGELDKAVETYQQEIESYPREDTVYSDLSLVLGQQGEYERAAEAGRQSLLMDPSPVDSYENLAFTTLALQRFDETRTILDSAPPQKVDHYLIHTAVYALAFLGADAAAMTAEEQWFAGKPQYENDGLALFSDTEAYYGRLRKARKLTKRAVESAIRADSEENGAVWQATAAQREAAFGNAAEARQAAATALRLAPASPGAEAEAALAFAMAGDIARAESLAQDLGKRFPLDTQMKSLWLPAIRAQLALDKENPAEAVSALPAASRIEWGVILFVDNLSCLYPAYVRGEAYLAARQGGAAAAEFQKILDHSGIVWNCWTGALAHLGVARANALQASTSQGADADAARTRALAAYKDFLTLWKDADPDLPILRTVKAEYTRLQQIRTADLERR
jgi:DNA-binding winged helix-turn-helix (wHTH) protein/Flp pilus assembly protein TadD